VSVRSGRARWVRTAAKVAAVAGVILVVLTVRVVTSSKSELEQGDRLRGSGDLVAAVTHYRRAARWYAPGNPHSAEALVKLAEIGREAEESGDTQLALSAWRAARAGINSTRPPIDAGKSHDELRREHLALLTATTRPNIGWTVVLLLGFAAWVGGAFAFVTRAVDEEDRLVPRLARRWGTVVVVGFGLFVLGMALA